MTSSSEEQAQDVYSLEEIVESAELASAVLGASDSQNCSYKQGYVYRQALYCCLTCLNQTNKTELHGICLACSYECHSNHDLVELYTKRNFRCDCGNAKFSQKCKLEPEKDELNASNKYNHNFSGLYCTCNRPYPDNENLDDTLNNDEMIQCTLCEDWFHLKHLLGTDLYQISEDNDYEEMICQSCMFNNQFLWYYQDKMAFLTKSDLNVDVETLSQEEKTLNCKLETLKLKHDSLVNEKFLNKQLSCFLLDNWRDNLCKCEKCVLLYKEKNIEFLTSQNDTIKYYEECGKKMDNKNELDQTKKFNDELSKMNRVTQVEFLHNLNDFKSDLVEFLSNFAQNGQIVKRENILEFFDDLNQKKKRKLNNSSSYFCK